jgi:hypothetical protein
VQWSSVYICGIRMYHLHLEITFSRFLMPNYHDRSLTFTAMKQGADDLGDDFVVDDIVALSGDEGTFVGGFLSDSEEAHDSISVQEADSDRNPQPNAQAGYEKKRKRREREKDRKAKVRDMLPVNHLELIVICN